MVLSLSHKYCMIAKPREALGLFLNRSATKLQHSVIRTQLWSESSPDIIYESVLHLRHGVLKQSALSSP
eukprot:5516-Eustigmatos_ZCMA.PRE.1